MTVIHPVLALVPFALLLSSVHTTLNESTRLDENNVDMDQEQVELARTAYEYQFMISSVSSDLSRLRSAAKNF